ncbi:MAG: PDZ domain-containing protein [Planctomycetota bacterium]
MKQLFDRVAWPLAAALVLGAGLLVAAQPAAAQSGKAPAVKVKTPGVTVQVGPDRGAVAEGGDAGGAGSGATKPGVRVRVNNGGRIVRIGPDKGAPDGVTNGAPAPASAAPPSYWVGILGGDVSPELRTHLGPLVEEEETGVIIREVVAGSPAEAAGLKEHDILLRANGKPIAGMATLVEEVAAVAPSKGQITIDLIRAGRRETKFVKPAERPASAMASPAAAWPGMPPGVFGGNGFGDDVDTLTLRMFGNGGVLGGAPGVQVQANGTSVSVTSVNGKTRVKVQQGDQEWDIDASEPKALDQLPPDVRAIVDGVIGSVDVDVNVDRLIPDVRGFFGRRGEGRRDEGRRGEGGFFGRRDRQIEAMQRQIDEMQRRLFGGDVPADPESGAGDQRGGELDEAPPFGGARPATPPAPVEVEIPAEEAGDEPGEEK